MCYYLASIDSTDAAPPSGTWSMNCACEGPCIGGGDPYPLTLTPTTQAPTRVLTSSNTSFGGYDDGVFDDHGYASHDDDGCYYSGWVCSYGEVYFESHCSDDTCADCAFTSDWDEWSVSGFWVGSSFECHSPDGGTTYFAYTCSDASSERLEVTYQYYGSDSTCTTTDDTYFQTLYDLCEYESSGCGSSGDDPWGSAGGYGNGTSGTPDRPRGVVQSPVPL